MLEKLSDMKNRMDKEKDLNHQLNIAKVKDTIAWYRRELSETATELSKERERHMATLQLLQRKEKQFRTQSETSLTIRNTLMDMTKDIEQMEDLIREQRDTISFQSEQIRGLLSEK